MKNYKLANKIKEMRRRRAWSQSQLAEVSLLSIRTIQRIENKGTASFETLLSIASVFEVDVKEFTSLLDEKILFSISNDDNNLYINIGKRKYFIKSFKSSNAALIGSILIFPAIYFLISAILKYVLGFPYLFDILEAFYADKNTLLIFNIISPIIFLTGLSFALILNLTSFFSFSISKHNGLFETVLSFKKNIINLLICCISLISLVMLFAYSIGENFTIR